GDMDCLPLKNGLVAWRVRRQWVPRQSRGNRPVVRHQGHSVTLDKANGCVVGPTHPSRALSNGVEHRLDVGRRAGNNAKNLTRRSLLLQGLLKLVEQPHVLDRDHGLIGEGFKELDLNRGEWAHLGATCRECSNKFLLVLKWNGQITA